MLLLLLAALLLLLAEHVDSSPLPDSKNATQEDWLTRAVHYMHSNPETIEELMTQKYALLEGDIVLSSDRNAGESTWPTPDIPYVISPELEGRKNVILAAMALLSNPTCVSFHEQTSETNYLHFVSGTGCASYVGFIGGEQFIFIAPACSVGNIAHEIIHALGFHHEHTRMDRENYITVLQQNVMEGKEKNFEKRDGRTFDLSYDVTSIMHYGSDFFSANGLPTIVPKFDEARMGQRAKLTETDIKRICLLYRCAASQKAHAC